MAKFSLWFFLFSALLFLSAALSADERVDSSHRAVVGVEKPPRSSLGAKPPPGKVPGPKLSWNAGDPLAAFPRRVESSPTESSSFVRTAEGDEEKKMKMRLGLKHGKKKRDLNFDDEVSVRKLKSNEKK